MKQMLQNTRPSKPAGSFMHQNYETSSADKTACHSRFSQPFSHRLCRYVGLLSSLLILSGTLARAAHSQTVATYTSLQSWQAATANTWLFTADFSNFTKDTYFQVAPVSVGPFTLQQIGSDPTFGGFENFIDVPPLQFTDNSGTTNAALYVKSGLITVTLRFNAPTFAWGAQFYGAQTGELLNLGIIGSGGYEIATVPVTVNTGFFGIVVSPAEPISAITFTSQLTSPDLSVGQGVGLEEVTGAYVASPTIVPETQIQTTASGLAYSRVTRAFTGTVTIRNVGAGDANGPFHIIFASLPAGVTLFNAAGTYNGSPYITVNVTGLSPGQTVTTSMEFSDPANVKITTIPLTYSGGFN